MMISPFHQLDSGTPDGMGLVADADVCSARLRTRAARAARAARGAPAAGKGGGEPRMVQFRAGPIFLASWQGE